MIRICASYLLITQTFMPIKALKKPSDINEFTVEDQKTHRRQNYVMARAMDEGMPGNDDIGVAYTTDYFDVESSPEELPSFIVDYANMIKNDIILLDNSVETRTRKRGNIKVEKYKRGPLDFPCSCEHMYHSKETIDLGEEYFPRFIETKNCSKRLCPTSYNCQKNLYNITILKKTGYPNEVSPVEVPRELKHRWVAIRLPVTTGCICARDHVDSN
ncbi:unnamed protein product [Parnassius mnemosyne]|uniref:Prothoracicotropic hormone n=1 Tax=Parnassius mnemosyne TaxID=213953 RepID=A0AAV1MC21_9NEOP